MNKNRIRITETQLHETIKASVKKVLSELDWKTTDSAAGKAESFDCSEDVMNAISLLREYLGNFASNKDDGFNSQTLGYTEWKGSSNKNHRVNRLLRYLDEIENFTLRKREQVNNLQNYADKSFERQHDGMSRSEFDRTIPDDMQGLNDKQSEYVIRKW